MMRLDPAAVSAGVRLATCDEIGSTNTEGLTLARAGERGPLWIVAERQTSGRGRHGRVWISEPGNLYATLLLTDAAPPPRGPELALVAGVAVYDAVADAAPPLRQRLMLKWPNDLLCGDAKLAGVLIEGEATAVAIGIGINCRHHPADTRSPATDLFACGFHVSPADVMGTLSKTMFDRLNQWQRGDAFAAIRHEWLERAQALGSAVSVRVGEREISGSYQGVDHHGRLALQTADRLETISAGDVLPMPETPTRTGSLPDLPLAEGDKGR